MIHILYFAEGFVSVHKKFFGKSPAIGGTAKNFSTRTISRSKILKKREHASVKTRKLELEF